jgi:hypothetical protein
VPFALAFFDRVRVVAASCELRDGYRHFRTDRITAPKSTAPGGPPILGIPSQDTGGLKGLYSRFRHSVGIVRYDAYSLSPDGSQAVGTFHARTRQPWSGARALDEARSQSFSGVA